MSEYIQVSLPASRSRQVSRFLQARRFSRSERASAARLLSIQAQGERVARNGALDQLRLTEQPAEQKFLRRQARQEQFHAWLFANLAAGINANEAEQAEAPAALRRIEHRLKQLATDGEFAAAVMVQHIALEGVGEAVLQRLAGELGSEGAVFRRVQNLVVAQEMEHVEFGRQYLRAANGSARLRRIREEATDCGEALLRGLSEDFAVLGGDVDEVLASWHSSLLHSH